MCRWLAYSGPALRLSSLLTQPDHSLIDQSRHARKNVETTNGDGFGVGWFGAEQTPGVYRSTHPAWNDTNFQHLAEHVHSGLFLAHVRAATGTAVQVSNCHPFTFGNWLFQHNGSIPEFSKLKRRLVFDVAPDLFPLIEGSTDSELLFFLALTFGLRTDPATALSRTVGHVERLRAETNTDGPFVFSACVSDGKRLWAVRYSSDGNSRTLYHSRNIHSLHDVDGTYERLPESAVILLSEPLDELAEHWELVPESYLLVVDNGLAKIHEFSAM